MPHNAPPAQSCASTAVDAPAATATATAVDANAPEMQKENILQSLKSDFTAEMQAAGKGLKTGITVADDVDAQRYCPQCRAIMLAGATDCNRCGYTANRSSIYNPLKDKFVAPLIWGGVVALVLSITFAWLSYFVGFIYKIELGFLGAALAIATVNTMRRKDAQWSQWHTIGAWTYIVGGYIIFRSAESAWLEINFFSLMDLLYIPLTGLVAYQSISKASRKRLVL